MEDPIDRGLPFELVDPWKPPFASDDASQHDSLFDSLDTILPPLKLPKTDGPSHFELDAIIPELEEADRALEPEPTSIEGAQNDQNGPFEDIDMDPWDFRDLLKDEDQYHLCTWEAFEKCEVPNSERTALISEAGPAAFDAAINLLPRLKNEVGVLPQDYALRALCNLAMGRSSTLFQWNSRTKRFEQTLQGASITGISRLCFESLAEDLIEMGSTIAKLRTMTERHRLANLPSASLALRSCVTSVLNAIDESMSVHLSSIQTILQLQKLLGVPQCLVYVLDTLADSVKGCDSDENVISAVSDRIFEEVQTQYDLCPILRALLARVSVPWLECLAADVGFCSVQTALASGYAAQTDKTKALEKSITFVEPDDEQLIHETRQAVKLLRNEDEYHALLDGDDQAFQAVVNPALDRNEVLDIGKGFEQKMMARLRNHVQMESAIRVDGLVTGTSELDCWMDEPSQQQFVNQTAALMSTQVDLGADEPLDLLHGEALALCQVEESPAEGTALDLAADLSTTPLERIRPLIQTQQRLVNGVLLRRLFGEYDLKRHLQLQKSFHLFGNGDFVLRLSTALFSQDTQSAERRRGATLTGEVMGLRLGNTHEERWPPASSELQLTLMGILNETYGEVLTQNSTRFATRNTLPGSLSFSIRQLPEAEIEQVLDPNSLYALDFLRLQYTTVSPFDAIITTSILEKYDGMFRFLLRLLRVIHVTANLRRAPSLHRDCDLDAVACSFAEEANHFVSVLMSHAMELGVNQPWRTFMKSVDRLSHFLGQEDEKGEIGSKSTIGVEGLRQLHDSCLETIRGRLFLKRKQDKLRKALEEALNAILKGSFALQRNDSAVRNVFEENHKASRQSIKQVCKLLQEHVDKPLKTTTAAEAEDLETNRILLSRLNWNGYYS